MIDSVVNLFEEHVDLGDCQFSESIVERWYFACVSQRNVVVLGFDTRKKKCACDAYEVRCTVYTHRHFLQAKLLAKILNHCSPATMKRPTRIAILSMLTKKRMSRIRCVTSTVYLGTVSAARQTCTIMFIFLSQVLVVFSESGGSYLLIIVEIMPCAFKANFHLFFLYCCLLLQVTV